WCGSGGLAGALARSSEAGISRTLKPPVLGIFASDHPVTAAQLAMCGNAVIDYLDPGRIKQAMARGIALLKLETPDVMPRDEAARHFAREIMQLSRSID